MDPDSTKCAQPHPSEAIFRRGPTIVIAQAMQNREGLSIPSCMSSLASFAAMNGREGGPTVITERVPR